MTRPTPSFRATVSRGKLYISPWWSRMANGGPMGCLARQTSRAECVADLTRSADEDRRELTVALFAGSIDRLDKPLTEWAKAIGYHRLWMPDGLIELDGVAACGEFGTRCAVCRTSWRDASDDFWTHVAMMGTFPPFCWVCGSLMAQWKRLREQGELPTPEAEERMIRLARKRRERRSNEPSVPRPE
jgi:hypothetical protein